LPDIVKTFSSPSIRSTWLPKCFWSLLTHFYSLLPYWITPCSSASSNDSFISDPLPTEVVYKRCFIINHADGQGNVCWNRSSSVFHVAYS
jgi:hypothetical protein